MLHACHAVACHIAKLQHGTSSSSSSRLFWNPFHGSALCLVGSCTFPLSTSGQRITLQRPHQHVQNIVQLKLDRSVHTVAELCHTTVLVASYRAHQEGLPVHQ